MSWSKIIWLFPEIVYTKFWETTDDKTVDEIVDIIYANINDNMLYFSEPDRNRLFQDVVFNMFYYRYGRNEQLDGKIMEIINCCTQNRMDDLIVNIYLGSDMMRSIHRDTFVKNIVRYGSILCTRIIKESLQLIEEPLDIKSIPVVLQILADFKTARFCYLKPFQAFFLDVVDTVYSDDEGLSDHDWSLFQDVFERYFPYKAIIIEHHREGEGNKNE